MVLIICTKNESNLTNRYWDMVLDRQSLWTDGRTTPKLYPGDKKSMQNYPYLNTITIRKTDITILDLLPEPISQYYYYQIEPYHNPCE